MPPWLRTRATYLALTLGTIALGLTIHRGGAPLGTATRDVVGDALWALMLTWALGALAPGARLGVRGIVAMTICCAVELSQLYHTTLLDAMRATPAGRLVLGSGFDPRDFAAYAGGVLAAVLLERLARSRRPTTAEVPHADSERAVAAHLQSPK